MILLFSLFLGFILGTILGSLALALAQRSLGEMTFFGRSFCPHCKKTLSAKDLIPVISYLVLKGHCRYCKKPIPKEYLIVELLTGLVGSLILGQFLPALFNTADQIVQVELLLNLVARLFMATVFIIVAITDYKKTIIPDRITYPAIKIVFLYLVAWSGFKIWVLYQSLSHFALGTYLIHQTDYLWRHSLYSAAPLWSGLIMAGFIGLFFLALILITRGRGMGGGDLKLGVLIGLYFGYPFSIFAILLSFLSGSVVAIFLILLGKKHFGQTIPFGPFLSLGSLITILWGNQIALFYNQLNIQAILPF